MVVLARPMRAMAQPVGLSRDSSRAEICWSPSTRHTFVSARRWSAAQTSARGSGAGRWPSCSRTCIRMYDTFVAEPYVSNASLLRVDTMYSIGMPDNVPNPITEPLRDYNLPLWVWGARHMRVEPFVIGGQALPLIYTDTAFAETDPGIFPTGRTAADVATAPVEMNIGEDFTGRLNMGAIGMDLRTGARLAVLGD